MCACAPISSNLARHSTCPLPPCFIPLFFFMVCPTVGRKALAHSPQLVASLQTEPARPPATQACDDYGNNGLATSVEEQDAAVKVEDQWKLVLLAPSPRLPPLAPLQPLAATPPHSVLFPLPHSSWVQPPHGEEEEGEEQVSGWEASELGGRQSQEEQQQPVRARLCALSLCVFGF